MTEVVEPEEEEDIYIHFMYFIGLDMHLLIHEQIYLYQNKSYPCTGLNSSQGLQEVLAPTIFRQSAHEGGKVVSPIHQPPLPLEKIPGTHLC
jgi:hypothetical protein